MNTGKIVLGTLAGFAIGAITGILFAPEKGSTSRNRITSIGDDYVDEIKSKYDEFRHSVPEKFKSAKDLADIGKAKYDDAKKDVENGVENYKQNGPTTFKHVTS